MVRVLHVVTYMGRGGLETMLMNYYRNIDRSKVQFDFLCHRDFEADYDAEILSLGGRIYRLPNLNPFSKTYLNALESFFAQHKEYKIVHSHIDCMSAIPLKYAKKYGVPVTIAHSHNSNQPKDKNYPLKIIYKRSIHKYADYLFACSKNSGIWMFGNKFSNDIHVMNNAIDTKQYIYNEQIAKSVREKYDLGNDFVVGHVGRFNTQKNHTYLIDIFNELLKIDPSAKLVLVGDGDLKKSIKKKIDDLNISDSVVFTGVVPNVNEIAQCFDVFCFPSLFEGLSVAMVEMQATGVKSVISDTISKECIITDNVEMLSIDANPKVWANKLITFKGAYSKKNMLDSVEKANFDIEKNAIWLQEFYLNEYNKH